MYSYREDPLPLLLWFSISLLGEVRNGSRLAKAILFLSFSVSLPPMMIFISSRFVRLKNTPFFLTQRVEFLKSPRQLRRGGRLGLGRADDRDVSS